MLLIALVFVGNFVILPKIRTAQNNVAQVKAENLDKIVSVAIEPDMTFFKVVEQAGLDANTAQELLSAAKDVYDLSAIRAGREIVFTFDHEDGAFKQIMYPISTEEELYIKKAPDNTWQAIRQPIDYEIKIKTVSGTIDSSLYESALAQNIDERAVIALADVFAWSIDFGMGIYQGDTYKFIYEERYRNGQYVMPGKILAARFVNSGQTVEGFYFSEGKDAYGELIEGYYDPVGKSLQKIFLKAPVSYRYISSGFTTGKRYISAFNISTGHRAIDYAAAYGTPIVSVGDGVVMRASWSSAGYGNLVSIRHNATYSTNYAHMSKFAVKAGQHVKQGQVIGYVGSTGLSTGPHVHFEMVQNGTKVNPQTVDIPSGKAVSLEKLEEFKTVAAAWQKKLD
ncbi:MAG: peptidoglycan DD-metalloendopeptidase family protein [Patescibacteria group bacterium]